MTVAPSTSSRKLAERRVRVLRSRIARFQALNDDEQLVLAALSLFPISVTRSELVLLCRCVGLLLGGKTPDASRLGRLAEKAREAELVSWEGSRIAMDSDLGLLLVRLAAETPFGERLRHVEIQRAISILPSRDASSLCIYRARLLRWAKRPQDAGKLILEGLRTSNLRSDSSLWFGPGDPLFALNHVPNWDRWLPATFRAGLADLCELSWEFETFASLAAPDASIGSELFLPIDHPAIPTMRAMFEARNPIENGPFRDTWYYWRLLNGDLTAIQVRANQEVTNGVMAANGYLAVAALAQGRLDASLELFAAAIADGNDQGVAPFHGTWLGALHVVALLARRSPDSLAIAQRIIMRLVGKGTRRDACDIPGAFVSLAAYLSYLSGRPPGQLRSDPSDAANDFETLILLISIIWSDPPAATKMSWKHFAVSMRDKASGAGLAWLTAEFAGICERLSSSSVRTQRPAHSTDFCPLVDLILPRAPWELALESLERVAAVGPDNPGPGESPKAGSRIAWFVQVWGDRLQVEPRLQSQKGAGYTRGRAIALQHFLPPAKADLPISEADARVSAHIHQERSYYGPSDCSFVDTVCLGLVGHPHVFDHGDAGLRYEVKLGSVSLRCDQTATGEYLLRLEPSIASVFKVQGEGTKAFVQRRGNEIWAFEVTANLKRVALLVGQELKIPRDGEARLRELLPRISALVPTTASLIAGDDAEVMEGDSLPVIRIRPKAETLRLQLLVTPTGADGPSQVPGIGPEISSHFSEGRALHVRRSLTQERSRATALWHDLDVLGEVTEDFAWTASDLLECLTLLAQLGNLPEGQARIEWPEGQPLRLKRVKRLTVDIQGGTAAKWFEAEGALELDDGAELRIFEVLAKLERRLGRFVALASGDFAELSQSAVERLTLLQSFSDSVHTEGKLRIAPWMAIALPNVADPSCVESGSEAWQRWRQRSEAALARDFVPTKKFTGTLRDYQLDGFRWLCRMATLGTGVCLADDMGLGKTVQALALLQHRARRKGAEGETLGPMLIVAPASVCPGWIAESHRFTPNLEPRWLSGKGRSLEALTRKTVLICTYDVLHRDIEALKQIQFDTVVLDEAHNIKNAHTRRARAAFSLNARFRLATTGTPIENHLGELWSLFHFLMPGLLGDQHRFVERFRSPIENAKDTSRKEQLRAIVQPFLLRRTKQQVLSELPEKTEVVRHVELSQAEVEIYEAVRQRGLDALSQQVKDTNHQRVRVLAEIMRLRRVCCHPRLVLPDSDVSSSKLQALLELVTELRDAGHRALVFSQFVDHLALVREALDDMGVSYQYLDGSTRAAERARSVEAFQSGLGDLFLISLRAGGTGLNLTAADYVIHLDPWWNPAVEDQASDRAHRIGQERPVTIYRLVTTGTIEQKLVNMHTEKRTLAADILADTDTAKRLDPEELMGLLREVALGP